MKYRTDLTHNIHCVVHHSTVNQVKNSTDLPHKVNCAVQYSGEGREMKYSTNLTH